MNRSPQGFEIPDADIAILRQQTATHSIATKRIEVEDGRVYRLFTAIPKAAAPACGFPVLYMLDGNGAFAALDSDILAAAPELYVVGIGYDTPKAFDVNARSLDYTPPLVGRTGVSTDPDRATRQVGGAPLFLERLVGPLRQIAEAGLPVDPNRRALWGHSYGGLFTLFCLFRRPESFNAYVAVSPSLFFGGGTIFAAENQGVKSETLKHLLVMHGDMESRSGEPKLNSPRPNPEVVSLVERLRNRSDLNLSYRILPDAQHNPALIGSLPSSIRFARSLQTDRDAEF